MSELTTAGRARTLADSLDERRNALNVIRVGLAVLVIVDHAAPLGGFGDEPRLGTVTLGSLAVAGFFTLSGYLIAASRTRTTTARFFWHRFLRIFPGYWVCLLAVAGVFGPLAWWHVHGGLGGYGAAQPVRYLVQNLPLLTPRVGALPGTLDAVPKRGAWNTSLWTLQWELVCYAGLAALASLGLLGARRRVVLTWLLALVVLTGVVDSLVPTGAAVTLLVRFGAAFLSGVVLYAYADRVRFSGRLAALACAAVLVGAHLPRPHGLIALPLAYLLLWLGARWKTGLCRTIDLSYGIYIYAFPVQQTLALHHLDRHGHLAYFAAGVVCTLPLAAISFLAVERPALRARRWSPWPVPAVADTTSGSLAVHA